MITELLRPHRTQKFREKRNYRDHGLGRHSRRTSVGTRHPGVPHITLNLAALSHLHARQRSVRADDAPGLRQGGACSQACLLAEHRLLRRPWDIERLLDKRGIAMTPADRERISSCRDGKTLDTWLDRVLTIADLSELFAD